MTVKGTDMTSTPDAPAPGSPDRVELPVIRLEDGRRRLHGAVWAGRLPPAAAAMPIRRSRLRRLIGTLIVVASSTLLLLITVGVVPLPRLSAGVRSAIGLVPLALLVALGLGPDAIERWWLRVRSGRLLRRWPAVTVFGVVADTRPGRDGFAVVAWHPRAHREHRYTRRAVVLRQIGAVPESAARAWHRQLEEINRRAAVELNDSYELVLSAQR